MKKIMKGMNAREMIRPRSEYRCPCCNLINISEDLINLDNDVIGILGWMPPISSACRCKKYNASEKIKGKDNSAHICEDPKVKGEKAEKCEALDYGIEKKKDNWQRAVITITLVELGIKRIGFGDDLLHWDIDLKKPYPRFWIY